jgi:hypothetical protein
MRHAFKLPISAEQRRMYPSVQQVGNLSEHARAKSATQLRGIHATRVYKKAQLWQYCQMFGTK